MNKKIFSIVGNPLSHSLSPVLHNYWFKKYNINAEYRLEQIDENQIEKILNKIRNKKIIGINITLPYKQKCIAFLDKVVNNAKETGSVNTIYLNNKEELIGENTDVYGLQAAYLKELSNNIVKHKKVLVLGAGGVSPSIILALKKSNITNVSVVNRTYEKTLFLKKKFSHIEVLKWEKYKNYLEQFDIIINATSLGLKNGEDHNELFQKYKKSLIYIDTIYNPIETRMLKYLKKNNIKTYNGLDMFIYQGQKSFYLWNKINPEIDDNLIELLKSKIND